MKLTHKIGLGMATLAIVGGTALVASAHEKSDNSNKPEWATKLHDAVESGDYSAWKAAQDERYQEMTSETRFNDIREFRRLMDEGKVSEAKAYAEEHNLPMGRGHRMGHHHMLGAPPADDRQTDTENN